MRKLIVCNIVSLDGYYEGPGKDVMPLFDYRKEAYPADESFDAYNAERLRAADTLLLGRTSYAGCIGYRHALIQGEAAGFPSAHRYQNLAWLRERTRAV